MSIKRILLVLGISSLVAAGCQILFPLIIGALIWFAGCNWGEIPGSGGVYGAICEFSGGFVQPQSEPNFTYQELQAFSASDIWIDISESNIQVHSFDPVAKVTFLSGSNPFASTNVQLQLVNGVISVVNPTALNNWVQTHGQNANGVEVKLGKTSFVATIGSNVVVNDVIYANELIIGDVFSDYLPTLPPCDNPEYECYHLQ